MLPASRMIVLHTSPRKAIAFRECLQNNGQAELSHQIKQHVAKIDRNATHGTPSWRSARHHQPLHAASVSSGQPICQAVEVA